MDNLNPRRAKVIEREETLLKLVREFGDLPFLVQNDEKTIVNFAYKFAMVNSYAELIPSFEAESDHSDLDLDKTLPNFNDTISL